MLTVTMEQAQAQLPELIHRLKAGEELVITENDQAVARIVAEQSFVPLRPEPGLCKGMVTIVADDTEHLNDFTEHIA
jgi:antitoxin (DNA-binding transcriptional repressor) of toxin-antitoxin stability system